MSWKEEIKKEDRSSLVDIRRKLVDMGDGVPLSIIEENIYQALANVKDMWEARDKEENEIRRKTIKRLEDALEDVAELLELLKED